MVPPPFRRRRVSLLDGATVLILLFAVFAATRSGTPLRAQFDAYLAERRVTTAAREAWPSLSVLAAPLYDGKTSPDIVEISDYECPFCRAAQPVVDSARTRGLRIAMLHLPGPSHHRAAPAALAALCAEASGLFAAQHAFLMQTDAWLRDTSGVAFSAAIRGSRASRLAECVASPAPAARLAQHIALAQRLRIEGTPTFVSPRGVVVGVPSLNALVALAGRQP